MIQKLKIVLTFTSVALLISCGTDTVIDDHGHSHDEVAISHTIWTDNTELFVEYKPFVVGQVTNFAAHFTHMSNFKAVEEGTVTVSLVDGQKGIRQSADAPSSPGIFRLSLQPNKVGVFSLIFDIQTPAYKDRVLIKNVKVYANEDEAIHDQPEAQEDQNEISYLKEQAWKTEFENAEVKRDTIFEVLKVGGEILPAPGDEITITATASGIVLYASDNVSAGVALSKGQHLFSISGGNITENNVEAEFTKAKARYDLAKSNFERKEKLYEEKAISKAAYDKALMEYNLEKSEFHNLSANYSKNGKSIKVPANGYLKHLFKNEGEFVEVGEPIAVVTQNKKLTIKAYVSQKDYPKLNAGVSSNFMFNGNVYSIEEFNGSLLSYGKNVTADHPKIPVYFELDNKGELLPGSFIEVWIKTQPLNNALKIPVSSLLESYGKHSVIVQTAGESFEQREVEIGVSDGQYVHIKKGLKEGERVVSKGAYQVKMASMSGQVPAHGHSH